MLGWSHTSRMTASRRKISCTSIGNPRRSVSFTATVAAIRVHRRRLSVAMVRVCVRRMGVRVRGHEERDKHFTQVHVTEVTRVRVPTLKKGICSLRGACRPIECKRILPTQAHR
jgi:hypothetical protein